MRPPSQREAGSHQQRERARRRAECGALQGLSGGPVECDSQAPGSATGECDGEASWPPPGSGKKRGPGHPSKVKSAPRRPAFTRRIGPPSRGRPGGYFFVAVSRFQPATSRSQTYASEPAGSATGASRAVPCAQEPWSRVPAGKSPVGRATPRARSRDCRSLCGPGIAFSVAESV